MTIFALATAPGKAGVAIIRISGSNAHHALTILTDKAEIKPRYAHYTQLYHPQTHELIDEAVVLWFPAPHSFTGEDVVELHIHGSRAVVNALFQVLSEYLALRLAEPGEFSRRAFINNKMDLTQAEGIADLIAAETSLQARQALRQVSGELEQLYEGWRMQLIHILAFLEAYIDFPDEDLPSDVIQEVTANISALREAITVHINDKRRGEKLREGLYVAIIGAPNAGKSSLLNYLAKRDVAIVSHIAGTTRDVIEVHLDIAGYPVIIADTAGLRESEDVVENEGIKRARKRAEQADLKIALFDAGKVLDNSTLELIDENTLIVINKIDTATHFPSSIGSTPALPISLHKNIGLDMLLNMLENNIYKHIQPSHNPVITRARYREHLQHCLLHLERFNLGNALELAAEDVRMAARQLGKITGKIEVEQVLDVIFSSFCIGK